MAFAGECRRPTALARPTKCTGTDEAGNCCGFIRSRTLCASAAELGADAPTSVLQLIDAEAILKLNDRGEFKEQRLYVGGLGSE